VESLPGGKDLLEELNRARTEANGYWKDYNRSADWDKRKKAIAADADAEAAEDLIADLATTHGQPELKNELVRARTQIAKIHDVERALLLQDGNVAAGVLARAEGIGKKAKYTGELSVISKFANTNKSAARLATDVPSAGVSALHPLLASAFGSFGYAKAGVPGMIAGAALPWAASSGARNAVMSGPYQKLMANPFYGSMTQMDTGANLVRMAGMAAGR
jgi:hypothetical protein